MAISPAPSIEVESNLAPEETQELRVNATAKFFDMYTNRVYSDKVLAVIREYLSNAWDAHREAGKGDEPCEVQLPTPDDPTWERTAFERGRSLLDAALAAITRFDDHPDTGGRG